MNKLTFLLITVFLSSCVGKMVPTSFVQIRNNYKFEFEAKSLGKPWKLSTSNSSNSGTIFINLNDIHSDLEIIVKVSKVDKSILSSESRLKVFREFISKVEDDNLFVVDSRDCDEALMDSGATCFIRIIAKYNKNNTEKNLRDGLDIKIQEIVSSKIEEPVEFNISFDMHRKIPPKVNNLRINNLDLGAVNYYANKEISETLFEIEGEFNYTVETSLNHLNDEYDKKIIDENGLIKANINLNYKDEVKHGLKDAELDVRIIFENGEEILKKFPLTAKRLSKPNLVIKPKEDNFVWAYDGQDKPALIKNIGETPIKITEVKIIAHKDSSKNYNKAFDTKDDYLNCLNKVYFDLPNSNLDSRSRINSIKEAPESSGNISQEGCTFNIRYKPVDRLASYENKVLVIGISDNVVVEQVQEIAGNISEPANLLAYDRDGKNISNVDFGTVIRLTNKEERIVLNNNKFLSARLLLDEIQIEDNLNNAYSIVYDATVCNSLRLDDKCEFRIKFNPKEAANYNSKLKIPYIDAYLIKKYLYLNLQGIAKTEALLSYAPLNFSEILKDSKNQEYTCSSSCHSTDYYRKKIQTITVQNIQHWDAIISTLEIIGDDKSFFTILEDNCKNKTLAKNATCTFKVSFDSRSYLRTDDGKAISANTKIKIKYNNGREDADLQKDLSGSILLKGIASISISSNFGTRLANQPQTRNVIISNANKSYIAKIKINSLALTESRTAAHWSMTNTNNCIEKNIDKNESCTFSITFKPVGNFDYRVDNPTIFRFPYNNINDTDITIPLNNNLMLTYENFVNTDPIVIDQTLEGKVGKDAELVITGVSSASTRTGNNYTSSVASVMTEGNLLSHLGLGAKTDSNLYAYWDFDKAIVNVDVHSDSHFKIRLKNIGWQSATGIKSNESNTNFPIVATNETINGKSERDVILLKFRPESDGIKTLDFSNVLYQSGYTPISGVRYNKTINISYSKTASEPQTGRIQMRGFGIVAPTLTTNEKNSTGNYGSNITASTVGNLAYGLGENNNRIIKDYKLNINNSTIIPEPYKDNIIIDGTTKEFLPVTVNAIPKVNTYFLQFIDNNGRDYAGNIPSSSYYDGAATFEYSVQFGVNDSSLPSTNFFTYNDDMCHENKNKSNNNFHSATYKIYNKYDSLNSNTTIRNVISFSYYILPALSISSATSNSFCYKNYTYNSSGASTLILKNNNPDYSIKNLSAVTHRTCGSVSSDAFRVLFFEDDGFSTCNINRTEACKKGSYELSDTCKACLVYQGDRYRDSGYSTITQDINFFYDIGNTKTGSFIPVLPQENDSIGTNKTNMYFLNTIASFDFSTTKIDGRNYKISYDGSNYMDYSTSQGSGFCNDNIKNYSDIYLKRRLVNKNERTLVYKGLRNDNTNTNNTSVNFIPSGGAAYFKPTVLEHNGSPFKIKIDSFKCYDLNSNEIGSALSSNLDIFKDYTCDIVYKASTNTYHQDIIGYEKEDRYDDEGNFVNKVETDIPIYSDDILDTFSDLCEDFGGSLSVSSQLQYLWADKNKNIRQNGTCNDSTTNSVGALWVVGSSTTSGF